MESKRLPSRVAENKGDLMETQANLVVNILTEQLAQKIKENAILQADLILANEKLREMEKEND